MRPHPVPGATACTFFHRLTVHGHQRGLGLRLLPWLLIVTGSMAPSPRLMAASAVVARVRSLDLVESDQRLLSNQLAEVLGRTEALKLLGPAELAGRARAQAAFSKLLEEAERAFVQGRKQHIGLEPAGAIAAYRQAIAAYEDSAATFYLPAPLSEAHLQLAAVLAESGRHAEAAEQMKRTIALVPWRTLDPSAYNPTLRKLFDRQRGATERLPDPSTKATTLRSLGRLCRCRHLVRPVVESAGEGLVLRAAVIDLPKAKLIGVESVLLERSLKDAQQRLAELAAKLGPHLGVGATAARDARPERPSTVAPKRPSAPSDDASTLSLQASSGLSVGFGGYPRVGARVLKLSLALQVHPRLCVLFGSGLRLERADDVVLNAKPRANQREPTGDLLLTDVPLEVTADLLLARSFVEVHLRAGLAFDLVYLKGSDPQVPDETNNHYHQDSTFGFGPGFTVGIGLRHGLWGSWSLFASAAYRLSKLFWTDELSVNSSIVPKGELRPPLVDLLQGVELTVGVTFDL